MLNMAKYKHKREKTHEDCRYPPVCALPGKRWWNILYDQCTVETAEQ